MDKGFNDDELADIMNEIESLEKEFSEDVSPDDTSEEVVEEEVVAEHSAEEHEESLVEVKAEDDILDEPIAEQQHEEAIEEVFVAEHVAEPVQEVTQAPIKSAEETPVVEVDDEMEEVLSELSDMPADEIIAKHKPHDDQVHHLPKQQAKPVTPFVSSGGQSSMNFHVEGDMKLDLSFNISGKVVHLNINEHGFELELEGGMKFSIPLDEAHSHKKAA